MENIEHIEYDPDVKMAPMELHELNNVEAILKTVQLNPISNYTYAQFRQKLLPIIATASTGEFNITAWLEEVEHPFVEVHIYDGDTIRYKIPPLLDQQETVVPADGSRIGDHIQELLSIRSGSVQQANRVMLNALSRTSDASYDRLERANAVLKALNVILTDHNYPPVPLGEVRATDQIDAPNAVSEDVVVVTGYDPL